MFPSHSQISIQMKQFKVVGLVSFCFCLNYNPCFALSEQVMRSPHVSKTEFLAQKRRNDSELSERLAQNLAGECIKKAVRKNYSQEKTQEVAMNCWNMFDSGLTYLRDGTIVLSVGSTLNTKEKTKAIVLALGDNDNILKYYQFMVKNLGEKEAGKLTKLILYAVAANFLQEDRNVNMGL
jgi:hypothetical protein